MPKRIVTIRGIGHHRPMERLRTGAALIVAMVGLVLHLPVPALATTAVCGRPLSTGAKPLASDCLYILRAAVGQQACHPSCLCDTNNSRNVSATDALLCLRSAVGQTVILACGCDTSIIPVPICGNSTIEPGEPCDLLAMPSGCASGKQCDLVKSACVCDDIPAKIGSLVVFTPPPPTDPGSFGLPLQDDGSYLVFAAPETELRLDPSLANPVTAVARCARWISLCYSPPSREIDDCARSAPVCQTPSPWFEANDCCPATCFADYETRRLAGVSPILALDQTLFEDGSCMPGLLDFLEGN